jgi:NitT/TauT family transport system permease protein
MTFGPRKNIISNFLPLAAIILAIFLDLILQNSIKHPPVLHPYFLYFLFLLSLIFLLGGLLNLIYPKFWPSFSFKAKFFTVFFLLLSIFNLVTSKFCLIPDIFFPGPDRILAVLVEERSYILIDCLGSSLKLLFTGFLLGSISGIFCGIAIGFTKPGAYWLNPVIKMIGPIPPTAWIPLVLVAFPTTYTGALFLIALSVWFPTTLMTFSGISNIQNAFFEVSSTLGANRFCQIFLVGLPAAMPFVFIGLFSGI